jgi:RND family efflux transporter MFP subunit
MARLDSSGIVEALRREFVPFLQSCTEPEQLPEILRRLAGCLGADGAILWRADDEQLLVQCTVGSARQDWATAHASNTAGAAAMRRGAGIVAEAERGPYAAAEIGESLAQVAAIPVRGAKGPLGSAEFHWKKGAATPAVAEIFPEIENALRQTLPGLLEFETSRQNYIRAISRLMMLYDVGKVFHSTLDLGELAPHIQDRVQAIVSADAVVVWLLDNVKKDLYCAAVTDKFRGTMESVRVWASDAGLGATIAAGEPVILEKVDDEAWAARWGPPRRGILVVPLVADGHPLGAIEAVRGPDSSPFSEEDLRVLVDVAKQATVALRNAQRLQAERRVKELQALAEISQEITATLDIDRVLSTAVNRITAVLPVNRSSISILRKGRREMAAISGQVQVDRTKPGVPDLISLHEWLGGLDGDISVVQTDEGILTDHEDVREKFAAYFKKTGMRSFTSLLLKDGEGAIGALVLEGSDAHALTASHVELARIFANQVTVAVRNALLYQQVPLAGMLQPLARRKAKFEAMPVARRRAYLAGAVVLVLFLVFFPWWSKPTGDARVLPEHIQPVSAELEGTVRKVLVHEGERVAAGQLLAEIAADEQRVALEQAQAQYDIQSRRVLQLEGEGKLGEARIERARMQEAAAKLGLERTQLTQTQLRAPITGVVVTPRLEERVGQYLKRGDVFCQVVDLTSAWAEVSLPEGDIGEVAAGEVAWLKLNTYPTRKFVGKVIQVAPQAREQSDERYFDVIVEVPNPDMALRAGMMGRGKVLARRASVGYLLLRTPARWIWLKIWKLLP